MSLQDMRRAPRFKGTLPVLLDTGTGVTRDYSTVGVYFVTDVDLCQGSPIDFVLLFNHLDAGREMRVSCKGTVVRTRQDNGRLGVAVQLNQHTFGV